MDDSSHILWPYEPEPTPSRDEFDEADLECSEYKLEKLRNNNN